MGINSSYNKIIMYHLKKLIEEIVHQDVFIIIKNKYHSFVKMVKLNFILARCTLPLCEKCIIVHRM